MKESINKLYNQYLNTKDKTIALKLVTNSECPTKILLYLLQHETDDIKCIILTHKHIGTSILRQYIQKNNPEFHKAILDNPNISVPILTKLCSTTDIFVQHKLINYLIQHNISSLLLKFISDSKWGNYISNKLQSNTKGD